MKNETILEIHKNGTYRIYQKDMSIIPQSEEAFKKIVNNERLIVKFTTK